MSWSMCISMCVVLCLYSDGIPMWKHRYCTRSVCNICILYSSNYRFYFCKNEVMYSIHGYIYNVLSMHAAVEVVKTHFPVRD